MSRSGMCFLATGPYLSVGRVSKVSVGQIRQSRHPAVGGGSGTFSASPHSGADLCRPEWACLMARGCSGLLLRGQRLFYPAVKYLLVSLNPAINLALNVGF